MLLEHRLASQRDANRVLVRAIGKDRMGCLSLGLYAGGVAASVFRASRIGLAAYVVAAFIWRIHDSRVQKLSQQDEGVDA